MVAKIIDHSIRVYKQIYSNYVIYAIVFKDGVNMDNFIDTYDRTYIIDNMWRTITVNNIETIIISNRNVIRVSYNLNNNTYYNIILYRDGIIDRRGYKPNIISLCESGLVLERLEERLVYKYISRLGYKSYLRNIEDVEIFMSYNGLYKVSFKCKDKSNCIMTLHNISFNIILDHLQDEKYIHICETNRNYLDGMINIISS